MAINLDSIRASYAAGISTRDRLTGYSPVDMKEILNRIHQMVKGYQKMEAGEEYFPNATMKLSYGGENGDDAAAIDFILLRATLTWGWYDTWSVELNQYGIFAKYKPEHGAEEDVFTLGWSAINTINTLFD